MTSLTRHENGNIEITLTVLWPDIQKAYNIEVEAAVAQAEITGFRKGKAPRNMVEPRLDKTKVYSSAIQKLLPNVYESAVKEHNLTPVISPNISLKKGDEGQDWEFTAVVCEAPKVDLPSDYETQIKKLKIEEKDDKLGKIIEHLKSQITVNVPDLLVEEEAEHRLSHLVENLSQLGITSETYLQSKKISAEDLRAQTAAQSRIDLSVQFILNTIQADKKLKNRTETLDFLSGLL